VQLQQLQQKSDVDELKDIIKSKNEEIAHQKVTINLLQSEIQIRESSVGSDLNQYHEERYNRMKRELESAQQRIESLDLQLMAILKNSNVDEIKKLNDFNKTLQQENASLQQQINTLQILPNKVTSEKLVLDEIITLRDNVMEKVAGMRDIGIGHTKALQNVLLLREEVESLKEERNTNQNTINQLTQKVQELEIFKQMYERLHSPTLSRGNTL